MSTKTTLMATVVVLAALAGSALGSCDDNLVRCYACDLKVHGNCDWYFPTKTQQTNCIYKAHYKDLPDGLRYLGFVWANYCWQITGCWMCSDRGSVKTGGTVACRERYGETLASGEMVYGACAEIGDSNNDRDTYDVDDDASEEERRQAELEAYQNKDIPSIDPFWFVNKPSAKSYAPPGRRAGVHRGAEARRMMQRKKYEDYIDEDMFAKRRDY